MGSSASTQHQPPTENEFNENENVKINKDDSDKNSSQIKVYEEEAAIPSDEVDNTKDDQEEIEDFEQQEENEDATNIPDENTDVKAKENVDEPQTDAINPDNQGKFKKICGE